MRRGWRSQPRVRGRAGSVAVETLEGDASALVHAWAGHEDVALVDAAAPAPHRGRCTSSAPATAALPAAALRSSTHAFGVADAVELAAALGRLPARLEIYAIEGAEFALGAPLSAAVARTVEALATRLLRTRRERHAHVTGVHACGRVGR